jgi:hypothetical protein
MWLAAAFSLLLLQSPELEKNRAIELAGVGFRAGNYVAAQRQIRQVLRSEPGNAYANDFLATTYLLQENVEAALKYWNRIGEPRIADVRTEPALPTNNILWDRSFTFSPAAGLSLEDFEDTKARIDSLGVLSRFRFELVPDGSAGKDFDVVVHALPVDVFGASWPVAAIALARGLPYETVQYDVRNIRSAGLNLFALARWDDQKRRMWLRVSEPIHRNPQHRIDVSLDGRDEIWDTGLEQFTIRKAEAAMSIQSHANARWSWSSGLRVSNRTSGKVGDRNGFLLTYQAGVRRRLLSMPERRLTINTSAAFEFGKQFDRTMVTAVLHWLPRAVGDDYESTVSVRAGRTGGVVPFDEYFALGLDRDSEYFLRGHRGIRGGRKGAGPIGREFLLTNFDVQKNLFNRGFLKASAGPFLDAARLTRTEPTMLDAGILLRLSLVSGLTLDFSYGVDLRARRGAFFGNSGSD